MVVRKLGRGLDNQNNKTYIFLVLFVIALHELCLATVALSTSCCEKFNKIFKIFSPKIT